MAYDLIANTGSAAEFTYGAAKFGNGRLTGAGFAVPSPMAACTSAMTIEGWLLDSDPDQILTRVWIGQGGAFYIGTTTTGNAEFNVVSGNTIVSTATVRDGLWHHWRVSWDASGCRAFIDGVCVGSNAVAYSRYTGTSDPTDSLGVGIFGRTGSLAQWLGKIDEVAIYSSSLSPTTASFTPPTAPVANNTSGLVALYHLNDDATNSTGVAEAGDIAAPVLSSPTASATSPTTATATVSTNEAGGLLYTLFSTNASEAAATIRSSGQSQAVTATGTQTVNKTGLTANTTGLKAHFVHDDGASTPNASNIVASATFSTPAAGDSTPPTLSLPTATKTGSTTATGTVTTNDATGVLRSYVSSNATESQATMLASGVTQAVSATGVQNVSKTGLTPSSTVRIHYMHTDPSGNHSTVQSSAPITLDAAASGALNFVSPTHILGTADGGVPRANLAVHYFLTDKVTGDRVATKTGMTTTAAGLPQNTTLSGVTTGSYYLKVVSDANANDFAELVVSVA